MIVIRFSQSMTVLKIFTTLLSYKQRRKYYAISVIFDENVMIN